MQQNKRLKWCLCFFSIKYRYSDIKLKKLKFHSCWFNFSDNNKNRNRAEPTCYWTNFPYASFGWQNGAFWYIVLRVMLLTCTRAMIRFSNCGGLSECHNMTQPTWQNECAQSDNSDQAFKLGIRPVWSESSLCTQWVTSDSMEHSATFLTCVKL